MSTTVQPTKPWKASKKDRLVDISIFLASLLASYAVVEITPMKGKLALFAVFFIVYMILTATLKGIQRGSAAAKDALVNSVVAIIATVRH